MSYSHYGKYVTREIIAESKYKQITAPMARYDGCRGGGNGLTAEWNCITSPLTMDQEPEIDTERDQFLLFGSTNVHDSADFQAEAEIAIGPKGKKFTITEPTCIYLPKGTTHGPVTFKSVKQPTAFLSWYLKPEYSTLWVPQDESAYAVEITKPHGSLLDLEKMDPRSLPPDVVSLHPPDIPCRHVRIMLGGGLVYPLWSADLGWPAKASWSYMSVIRREFCHLEPVHAHRESHQICMYLGGDPLDIEDFGGEIDVYFGKELERQTLDTTGVVHYVPGIPHIGDERQVVKKPFLHIMWVVGPHMNHYYNGAAADKINLTDEWNGEVAITPGAWDYVPPTPLAEYEWPDPDDKN